MDGSGKFNCSVGRDWKTAPEIIYGSTLLLGFRGQEQSLRDMGQESFGEQIYTIIP